MRGRARMTAVAVVIALGLAGCSSVPGASVPQVPEGAHTVSTAYPTEEEQVTPEPAVVPEATEAVMRGEMTSTLWSPRDLQASVLKGEEPLVDFLAWRARGRFTGEEVAALLREASPMADPRGRVEAVVGAVVLHDAGENHGWPSYRAAAAVPTDGELALGISWRFTVPHPGTTITEIEGLWVQPADEPLAPPEPRPEREPLTTGMTSIAIPDGSVPMHDGVVPVASIEQMLAPRVYTDGGVELLTEAEVDYLARVVQALVDEDRAVLEEAGAYLSGADPYLWVREYGDGVRLVVPPGPVSAWDVDVMQVDTDPGVSFLVVGMWTQQEGLSDLSLEINLSADPDTGVVSGEFVTLHVM